MTAENKESIKRKIKALLEKTPENGASEHEAIAALNKANELMQAYYIDKNDLTDPYLTEKCVLVEVKLVESAYNMTLFFGVLGELFDCIAFWNKRRIAFFGFENDAKLAGYFYELIAKTALSEAKAYKKSDEYKVNAKRYHGRSIVSSFVKGFLYRIGLKMQELYENRKSSIPDGMGIMLVNKTDKVKAEFKTLAIKAKEARPIKLVIERAAFNSGIEKGNSFQITQGIEAHKQASTLALA